MKHEMIETIHTSLSQRVCVGDVSRVHDTKNVRLRLCHAFSAYDEVFCLHTPSRARLSLMSVRDYECARFLQKGLMAQRNWLHHC